MRDLGVADGMEQAREDVPQRDAGDDTERDPKRKVAFEHVVTIKGAFTIRKHGGRKLVLAPDGAPIPTTVPHVDSTLVKTIACAFRWQRLLETGRSATVKEIAKAEKINP